MKGRFVGENIRLIDSLICYAKEQNIPGLLLFLDFEKAFDTIEWYFIPNILSFSVSVRGCPLSPYLFILTGEVLAKAGRKNENISGINVNDKEIEISQYADDTTLILDGSTSFLLSAG